MSSNLLFTPTLPLIYKGYDFNYRGALEKEKSVFHKYIDDGAKIVPSIKATAQGTLREPFDCRYSIGLSGQHYWHGMGIMFIARATTLAHYNCITYRGRKPDYTRVSGFYAKRPDYSTRKLNQSK